MKLKYYVNILAFLGLSALLASCEIFGLDFQDSYDYDYDAGMPSNKVNMSAYDFIKSRTDIFHCWVKLSIMQKLQMSLNNRG